MLGNRKITLSMAMKTNTMGINDPNVVDPNALPGLAMNATFTGSAASKDFHL